MYDTYNTCIKLVFFYNTIRKIRIQLSVRPDRRSGGGAFWSQTAPIGWSQHRYIKNPNFKI